jgi:uncharacterized oxidoreductase
MRKAFDLAGRTILVTGGSRGIGLETVRQLLARGNSVLVTARDIAPLDDLAEAHPGRLDAFAADLGTTGGVRALADWVATRHPGCSVVINNAAIMIHQDLASAPPAFPDDIAREIAVNLAAPAQLVTALLPLLSRQPSAAIVNVTSGLAIAPKRDAAVYCATKAGLRSFTRALRDQCEAAGRQILVSEVVMTLVDTGLSRPSTIRKYPPARAAADLLRGLEGGKKEIWIEKTRALRVLHRISPALAYAIMRGR